MSTPNKTPRISRGFGGQGQARPPKFKVGDIVHALRAPIKPPAPLLLQRSSSAVPPATSKAGQRQQAAKQEEVIPRILWTIKSITPSTTDSEEHQYELVPYTTPTIQVGEGMMAAMQFVKGQEVCKRGEKGEWVYVVEEVKVVGMGVRCVIVDAVGGRQEVEAGELRVVGERE